MILELAKEKKNRQIREILNFHKKLANRAGREISLSEAITKWIAFGFAEKSRKDIYLLND